MTTITAQGLHILFYILCLFVSACNCHRHSFDCYYDPEVDQRRGSVDANGHHRGGGVCLNCQVTESLNSYRKTVNNKVTVMMRNRSLLSITPLDSTVSTASPPTTGHLTTRSTPHWPAHVSGIAQCFIFSATC